MFITYWGQNALYHNNGDGTFTDVTGRAGLLQPGRRLGFRSYLDGLRPRRPLDLFVANYLEFDPKIIPAPGARIRPATTRARRLIAARAAWSRRRIAVPEQRRRHVHRRQRSFRYCQGHRGPTG